MLFGRAFPILKPLFFYFKKKKGLFLNKKKKKKGLYFTVSSRNVHAVQGQSTGPRSALSVLPGKAAVSATRRRRPSLPSALARLPESSLPGCHALFCGALPDPWRSRT